MKVEIYSEFSHDKISLISVDEVLTFLNGDPPLATVNQLYDFGKLLLDQIRALRASYDSKLASCLGWGTATIAIMLAGITKWGGSGMAAHLLISIGTGLALLSVLISAIGLKSWAGLKWPSEKDWFQLDYLQSPDKLKRYHLVAMLEAHQSYSRRVQSKGHALMASEYILAGSAAFLCAAVFMRQAP